MSHSKLVRRGHYASRSQGEWFALCSEYDRRSNLKESREQFCVRVGINASSFAGNYRKFKAGGLDQGSDMKRQRQRKFEVIEQKLISYIELRERRYQQDRCGLSWVIMREKCLQWAKDAGEAEFKCSAGWINDTIRRSGKCSVTLHGEGQEISAEDAESKNGIS